MATGRSAESVCRQWWATWTNGDEDEKRSLLAEDLVFRFNSADEMIGREAFLNGESWPPAATITLLAELYAGHQGAHFYEAKHGEAKLRVAEHLTVRNGRITEINFITDTGDYPAFIAGGS